MTPEKEKALWDFVERVRLWAGESRRGIRDYDPTDATRTAKDVESAARALLSVLAEEAPPSLPDCDCRSCDHVWSLEELLHIMETTVSNPQWSTAIREHLKRCPLVSDYAYPPCPSLERTQFVPPERPGSAPAPKQERGVEEILKEAANWLPTLGPKYFETASKFPGLLLEALDRYREERAASERVFDDSRAFASRLRATEAENASLRDRVEKARNIVLDKGGPCDGKYSCNECAMYDALTTRDPGEGKGEGTEATK